MKKWMLLILVGLSAEASVDFTSLTYAGSGCRTQDSEENVKATIGDGKLILQFKELDLSSSYLPIDRANCSVRITVQVNPGQQVGIAHDEISGAVRLPLNTVAALTSEVFFSGAKGSELAIEWKGKKSTKFRKLAGHPDDSVQWSACGRESILAINTAINYRRTDSDLNKPVVIAVTKQSVRYFVRQCQ